MTVDEWMRGARGRVAAVDAELIAARVFGRAAKGEFLKGDFGDVAQGDFSEVGFPRVDRSWVVGHGEWVVGAEEVDKAEEMLRRREAGEPLAYIFGEKEFFGRDFWVTPAVLVPRVETEGVVEVVKELGGGGAEAAERSGERGTRDAAEGEGFEEKIEDGEQRGFCVRAGSRTKRSSGAAAPHDEDAKSFAKIRRDCDEKMRSDDERDDEVDEKDEAKRRDDNDARVRILEVGTGSGCIAVTLKLEMPGAEVVATDVSEAALAVARENARRLGAGVRFLRADLLDGLAGEFEILVANLPYVDPDWEWVDKRALSFEPAGALYAEENGLAVYRRLFEELARGAVRAKCVVLEADPCQWGELGEVARGCGYGVVGEEGYGVVFERRG